MQSVMPRTQKRVLLPGWLLPALGLMGPAVIYIVLLLEILHPAARDRTLSFRLGAEIPVVFMWLIYKLGSQRVILGEDEMRIVTWGLCWRVPRGAVRDVEVRLR